MGTQLLGSYDLPAASSMRVDYPKINGGPLKIISTQKIIAAERVIYSEAGVQNGIHTSYSELMAIPNKQLDSMYVFPSYSYPNSGTWGQLRVANPSTSQAANVEVYLGTQLLGTYSLDPAKSLRLDFPGKDGGPLKVVNTNGTNIIQPCASSSRCRVCRPVIRRSQASRSAG